MNTLLNITVFDLDDTLYPELDYARSGLVSVGQALEQSHRCSGITDAFLEHLESGARHRIFNDILPKFDLDLALVPQLVSQYQKHNPEIEPFDDALPAIHKALALGPIALITDGHALGQRLKLEALKIAGFFDLIIVTDEAGADSWKPSPYAYKKVMQTFGAQGKQCTYVGDNVTKDFVTANELGWSTVQVSRPEQMYRHEAPSPQHKAKRTIETLKDLFRK